MSAVLLVWALPLLALSSLVTYHVLAIIEHRRFIQMCEDETLARRARWRARRMARLGDKQ
jgi:hypothetical protein